MAILNDNTNANRTSYFLTVTPVDYSLTAGTDIPTPESPKLAEPPTPGGGPLTSHPATPERTPSFHQTTEADKENAGKITEVPEKERADSFRTPASPASAAYNPSSPQAQKPKGVRRLLSLSSLRSSFSNSRTSLSLPRESNEASPQVHGVKRPSSPSMASTTASSIQPSQQLRSRKSGNWFKRKSSMLMMNGDGNEAPLQTLEEQRPDTRESKRLKESSPAPLLPEVGSLRGGGLNDGDLGWDATAFKRHI